MVSDPFLVGVFFGFVPSMGFLYILLNRFEGLFGEKRAFFAYLMGVGGGLLATLLQLYLGPTGRENLGLAFAMFGLFGLIHALIFAMVLNSKRFRGKRETPFYGVAFGLGFGGLNVLFLIGNAVVQLAKQQGSVLVEALSLSYVGLYFMGSILVHAGVGSWIGRGAATRSLRATVPQGALVEALYLSASYLLFVEPWGTFVPAVALVVAIAFIAYVIRTELEPLIPPEVRREMEIHKRRIAREVMLGATQPIETGPAEARTGAPPGEDAPPSGPPSP